MLRTYIYNEKKDNWIEEEHELLFHDLCAFLNDDNKTIYLWNGPKSTKDKLNKGIDSLKHILTSYQDIKYDIVILSKKIPSHLKIKLKKLLESVKREENIEKFQFTRFITIRSYFFVSLVAFLFPLILVIDLWSALTWSSMNDNFVISAILYHFWLNFASVSTIISIVSISIIFALSIYEYETQGIIIHLIGLIVNVSFLIYFQQGIYLFLFQPGFTDSTYIIRIYDVLVFLTLISVSSAIYELPSLFKLISFVKTYKEFLF